MDQGTSIPWNTNQSLKVPVWENTMNLKGIFLSAKFNLRKLVIHNSIYKSFPNDKKYRDENQITASRH